MISTLTRKVSAGSWKRNALIAAEAGISTYLMHVFADSADNYQLIIILRVLEGAAFFVAVMLAIYVSLDLLNQAADKKLAWPMRNPKVFRRITLVSTNRHSVRFKKPSWLMSQLKMLAVMIVGGLFFAFILSLVPWDNFIFHEEDVFRNTEQKIEQKVVQVKVTKKQLLNRLLTRHTDYDQLIIATCKKYSMDPDFVKAMIFVESDFKFWIGSTAGAQGLMQLMPDTADGLGVSDRSDPVSNMDGGVRYIKYLLAKYKGNVRLSLAAYNAGEGNVERYGGIPPFRETRKYVPNVLARYQYYKKYESLVPRKISEEPKIRIVEETILDKIKGFLFPTANAG